MKCYKFLFAIFSLIGLTDGVVNFFPEYHLLKVDQKSALAKLVFVLIQFFLQFMTQTYLVYIGIAQQNMFRKYGSIKGYKSDYLIVSIYFLLLFSLA